jgi:uncharacterized protein YbjT (DUF2867 family)
MHNPAQSWGIVGSDRRAQDEPHDAATNAARGGEIMFVVVGATGKTGSVTAETLLAQGKKVRVVVRDANKGAAWQARGAEVAVAKLDDARALEAAFAGATGVFALLPEDLSAPDFHAHRRRMADAIAGAVKASRVPHVVFLSAMAAVLPDGNGPGKDLHYAENALRATGAKLTVLRGSYFQENVLAALAPAQHEGIYPSFLPSADVALPTVATRDLGRIAAGCLVEPPATSETIDVLGPMYSVRQLADGLGRAIGKSLRVVDVPAPAHVEVLTKAGLPKSYAEALAEMFACFATGRVAPRGDRKIVATTSLDETLAGVLARS